MTLKVAFLVLEEHPYGQIMLDQMVKAGFIPGLVIQEVSPEGDHEREKFLRRMQGQPLAPRISQTLAGTAAPVYGVGNHNDALCADLLKRFQPEVTVLGGTRIIKQHILEVARGGTINAHPGLLPRLRGSASVGWALYKDLPIGASVHFIDSGIDTGDIILREALPVFRSDTYESLNFKAAELAARLMVRALQAFEEGSVPRLPQQKEDGETLRVIPDDLLEKGIQRLADGRYSHFSDEKRPLEFHES